MRASRFVAPSPTALAGSKPGRKASKLAEGGAPKLGEGAEPLSGSAISRAFSRVQEQLDALTQSKRPALITKDTTLRAGESVRISPRGGATLFAKLPKAAAENFGAKISVMLERPAGTLRISAQRPDTVVGVSATNFTSAGLIELVSNGVDAWEATNELPSTSPGGTALEAQYVLGAVHASLPNAAVGTDTPEINFVYIPAGIATWILNTASVAFSKLADLSGLSVLGRAANSAGVMAAITATAARQTLRANDAGTALEWSHPVEIRNNANTDLGDVFSIRGINGTNTTATVSAAAGAATFSWNVDDFPLSGLADQAADTFLGNFTAGLAPPTARAGASVAGGGLTYTTGGTLAVGAGSFITVNANDVAVNVATLVPAIDSASVVANGSVLERAALTGAISAAQESNQTLFAGIRDNGLLETARTHLNFVSTAFDTTFSVTQDAGNDELEVRVSTLGSFYAENSGGTVQTKFISYDNGDSTAADVVDNTGGSGYINVSYDYVGTSNDVVLNAITGAQGVVDISTLICGGRVGITAPTGAWSISGFTAKTEGFWFVFTASSTDFPGTIVNSTTANTGVRNPGFVDFSCNRQMSGLMMYGAFGGASQWLFIPGALDPTELSSQLATLSPRVVQVSYASAADASYSITPPAEATWYEAEGVGGGGGGGGADPETAQEGCAGGGGGSGGGFKHRGAIISGNMTGVVGDGGTAGTAAGGNGGAGTATTFNYGGGAVAISAGGGTGGTGETTGPVASAMQVAPGGNPGAVSGATEVFNGAYGFPGLMINAATAANSIAVGGNGGPSMYGGGGFGACINGIAGAAGISSSTPGSGGGGGAKITNTTAAAVGFAGSVGVAGRLKVTFYSGPVPTFATIT
jgi:hypothetical protein